MAQLDLMEINGNFEKGKPFVGTLGGELMQIYLILLELKKKTENQEQPKEGDKKAPKLFKDLLTRLGLTNFFINYLKEMKHETFHIQVS